MAFKKLILLIIKYFARKMGKEAVGLSNLCLKYRYLLKKNNPCQKRHMTNTSLIRVFTEWKKYSDTVFHIENVILRLQLIKVTLFIYRVTLNPGLSRLHLVSQCNFSLSFAAMSWFEQLVIWSLIYMAICDNKRQFHDTLWYKAPKRLKYVNLAGANACLTWILPTGKINKNIYSGL